MSVTFDQTKEGYVNGTSMPLAGCGPCSVASIACNIAYTTPKQVAGTAAEWVYWRIREPLQLCR